jgi:hypothetical protein
MDRLAAVSVAYGDSEPPLHPLRHQPPAGGYHHPLAAGRPGGPADGQLSHVAVFTGNSESKLLSGSVTRTYGDS